MDHVTDPAGAGALLGFVQGGGYIIASSMPFIAGLIRQQSSSLAQAWMVMAAGVAVLLLIAPRFAPVPFAQAGGLTMAGYAFS
eukprot:gene9884-11549_t